MLSIANSRRPGSEGRAEEDYYTTPPSATEALLAVENFNDTIWEPACGDGAISRVLAANGYRTFDTDLIDRGFGDGVGDFLSCVGGSSIRAIVTNPPFKLADEFVAHALAHPHVLKVAIFQRMAWLEGAKRHATLWGPKPPARVLQFSKRQTLWRGDDPNPQNKGGAISFGWFIWDRGHKGPPTLGWI